VTVEKSLTTKTDQKKHICLTALGFNFSRKDMIMIYYDVFFAARKKILEGGLESVRIWHHFASVCNLAMFGKLGRPF
jgi:hypothetical protein